MNFTRRNLFVFFRRGEEEELATLGEKYPRGANRTVPVTTTLQRLWIICLESTMCSSLFSLPCHPPTLPTQNAWTEGQLHVWDIRRPTLHVRSITWAQNRTMTISPWFGAFLHHHPLPVPLTLAVPLSLVLPSQSWSQCFCFLSTSFFCISILLDLWPSAETKIPQDPVPSVEFLPNGTE